MPERMGVWTKDQEIERLKRENAEMRAADELLAREREGPAEGAEVEIVSGGMSLSTSVKVDGKFLKGVTAVRWSCEVDHGNPTVCFAKAMIEIEGAKLNIKGTVPA